MLLVLYIQIINQQVFNSPVVALANKSLEPSALAFPSLSVATNFTV